MSRFDLGTVYNLGSQNPQDNTTWGLFRVVLLNPVAPGANVTFSLNVTAPSVLNIYNFQRTVARATVRCVKAK